MVSFVLDITPLVFLTINFGMGGAVIAFTVALCVFFRRMMRETGPVSGSVGANLKGLRDL